MLRDNLTIFFMHPSLLPAMVVHYRMSSAQCKMILHYDCIWTMADMINTHYTGLCVIWVTPIEPNLSVYFGFLILVIYYLKIENQKKKK